MKTTVIIPYRKDRGWLKKAIDSVPSWCELIIEQGNHNKAVNFNNAFKRATGDIIKVLDEDDILIEEGMIKQIKALEGYDCIHANAVCINKAGAKTGEYIPAVKNPTVDDMFKYNIIHNPTMIYRRSVFETLGGYDESLDKAEDYEYHLRCLSAGIKIGYCDAFVVYYREHRGQVSRVMKAQKKYYNKLIRRRYDTTHKG